MRTDLHQPCTARHLLQHVAGLALLACAAAAGAADFLDVGQAFRGRAAAADGHTLAVHIDVAPGYHLYRERLQIDPPSPGAQLGPADLPHGERKFDENLGQQVELLTGGVDIRIPVTAAQGDFSALLHYQGCADAGLCYPPQDVRLRVGVASGAVTRVDWMPELDAPSGPAGVPPPSAEAAAPKLPPAAVAGDARSASTRIEQTLHGGSLVAIAGVFALAGLLLSFTPCVLPMVPILSSIIVGQGAPVSRGRGFALAAAYALGMALVYTVFGVVAGLLGEGLAAALQNPWVLGAFAALLAGLSLSMFGVFELQMPGALQSRLSEVSGRLPGGRFAGVFLMGGLSALIVGPCVAAPLAGALVFISQTRDVVVGGLALFSLACGMSVPLLLVGVSAGSLLPRAGAWMDRVKRFFGVLLLAVALWIVSPVLPAWALMGVLGAAALVGAACLGVFDRLDASAGTARRLAQGTGLVLVVLGAAQVLGALSGGQDALQPLGHLARRAAGDGSAALAAAGLPATAPGAPQFRRIRNVAELQASLRGATRPVVLDFYADWCVACKELEHGTFKDPAVRQRLSGALLLQADVTGNSPEDKALMKQFQLFGPPGLLFFDAQGREQAQARVVGYVPAPDLLQAMARAGI